MIDSEVHQLLIEKDNYYQTEILIERTTIEINKTEITKVKIEKE